MNTQLWPVTAGLGPVGILPNIGISQGKYATVAFVQEPPDFIASLQHQVGQKDQQTVHGERMAASLASPENHAKTTPEATPRQAARQMSHPSMH